MNYLIYFIDSMKFLSKLVIALRLFQALVLTESSDRVDLHFVLLLYSLHIPNNITLILLSSHYIINLCPLAYYSEYVKNIVIKSVSIHDLTTQLKPKLETILIQ